MNAPTDAQTQIARPGAPSAKGSSWDPLCAHLRQTYQLTLRDDELSQIAAKADESRMKAAGRGDMVRWALVNALYHLDDRQLHELGEAIAERSGGTYTRNHEIHCESTAPDGHGPGIAAGNSGTAPTRL